MFRLEFLDSRSKLNKAGTMVLKIKLKLRSKKQLWLSAWRLQTETQMRYTVRVLRIQQGPEEFLYKRAAKMLHLAEA